MGQRVPSAGGTSGLVIAWEPRGRQDRDGHREKGAGPLLLTAHAALHLGALLALTAAPWALCGQAPLFLLPGTPGELRVRGAYPPRGLLPRLPCLGRSGRPPATFARCMDGRDSWTLQTCDSPNTTLLPHPASEPDDFLKKG